MNKDEGLFSLFGEAAHRSQMKKKERELAQSPSTFSEEAAFSEKKGDNQLEETLQAQLNHARDLRDELNRKLEELYQKAGWDPANIKDYLNNPSNFSQDQWQLIQSQKKQLLNKIWGNIGKEGLDLQQKMLEAGQQKTTKSRKSKGGGARRQWIQM